MTVPIPRQSTPQVSDPPPRVAPVPGPSSVPDSSSLPSSGKRKAGTGLGRGKGGVKRARAVKPKCVSRSYRIKQKQ